MIVQVDDFVGKYELHVGMYDQAKLQEYIDIYEKRYLVELFGAKLYDEFISDLTPSSVPRSPNFQFVFNSFYQNINLHTIIQSDGIKTMLKGFIYFEYIKDTTNQMTPNGMVIPSNENSTTASTLYSMMYARYNEAIRSFRAIQTHIMINLNVDLGQVVFFDVINPGTNYISQMNISTTSNGNGSGATFNITTDLGMITDATLNDDGKKYQVNEVLTLVGGDNNAQLLVTYVGVGDYSKFNGISKQFAYWL